MYDPRDMRTAVEIPRKEAAREGQVSTAYRSRNSILMIMGFSVFMPLARVGGGLDSKKNVQYNTCVPIVFWKGRDWCAMIGGNEGGSVFAKATPRQDAETGGEQIVPTAPPR